MIKSALASLTVALSAAAAAPAGGAPATQPGLVLREFIANPPPTKSSHASTIEQTRDGVLAAWFGGPYERHPEVEIWTARLQASGWSAPVKVADGIQADGKTRHGCWNPVLFQPKEGPLLLFYKVGPSPESWWGMLMTSTNAGRTWSVPVRLPEGQVGPVRNKPVQFPDGGLLCGSSTEDHGWRLHMEWSPDLGRTWERTPVLNDGKTTELIQPTILRWPSGSTQILNRSRRTPRIFESRMGASWRDWTPPAPTSLPNPNSGIDAVVLRDGRGLLVYNHAEKDRSPVNVAVSSDGRDWQAALVLEDGPGEFSYPAVIQAADGKVHITYTWKRERIRHVVVDPAKLDPRPMAGGSWPSR